MCTTNKCPVCHQPFDEIILRLSEPNFNCPCGKSIFQDGHWYYPKKRKVIKACEAGGK